MVRTPRELKAMIQEARCSSSNDNSTQRQSSSQHTLTELRRKYAKLKALSDDDQQLVAHLRQQLQQKTSELVDVQSTMRSLRRTYEDLSSRSAADRKRLEFLETEIDSLRSQPPPSSSTMQDSSSFKDPNLNAALDRISVLENELDQARQELDKVSRYETGNSSRNKLHEISVRQLTEHKSRAVAEKEQLCMQLKSLKDELKKERDHRLNQESQTSSFQSELAALRRQNQLLIRDFDSMEAELSAKHKDFITLKKELTFVSNYNEELEAENSHLVSQFRDLQSELSSKTMTLARDWEEKGQKNVIESDFEVRLKEKDAEISSLRHRVDDLVLQNEKHLETNLLIKHELQEEKGLFSQEKQRIITRLETEKASLLDSVKSLDVSRAKAEKRLTSEKAMTEKLKSRVDSLDSENASLKYQLNQLSHDTNSKGSDLEQKLNSVLTQKQQLVQQLSLKEKKWMK
ncbi:hypothetical protein GEMRC1_010287 [Eukaryota sp. GEM-RC1]